MSRTEVLLIRHAHAGKRGNGADDERRPLSSKGLRQAAAIAERYRGLALTRTVTSPYLRCVETIVPLALAGGTDVEELDDIAEGAGSAAALALIEQAASPIALCTHGDVIGEVLALLDRRGVPLDADGLAKGSTWELTVADGVVTAGHYVAPPR
jgi:8-oxo-dGTP diphosphatase